MKNIKCLCLIWSPSAVAIRLNLYDERHVYPLFFFHKLFFFHVIPLANYMCMRLASSIINSVILGGNVYFTCITLFRVVTWFLLLVLAFAPVRAWIIYVQSTIKVLPCRPAAKPEVLLPVRDKTVYRCKETKVCTGTPASKVTAGVLGLPVGHLMGILEMLSFNWLIFMSYS